MQHLLRWWFISRWIPTMSNKGFTRLWNFSTCWECSQCTRSLWLQRRTSEKWSICWSTPLMAVSVESTLRGGDGRISCFSFCRAGDSSTVHNVRRGRALFTRSSQTCNVVVPHILLFRFHTHLNTSDCALSRRRRLRRDPVVLCKVWNDLRALLPLSRNLLLELS